MRLQDKRAIITGAASGFGTGIARKFAAEGARIMVADINDDQAHEVAKEVDGVAHHVDLAQDKSVAQMARAAHELWGHVDIIVNNAGVTHQPKPLEEVDEDEFDRVLGINAKSVYLTSRYFVPSMKAAKTGVILNMASTAALSPRPNLSWYNASKGWMVTATKAMAIELAPHNVRVNAICPVAGETPLLKSFMGDDSPAIREKFLSSIPIGRFSTPEDMGNAACFLCSDEASMITGVAMEVDGGRCI